MSDSRRISDKAVIRTPESVQFGRNVTVMEFSIIGARNYYQDIFDNDEQRIVRIGDDVTIYPMSVVFEGATLSANVAMEERTSVGSHTFIGIESKILYQAQINDFVTIGQRCILGGFVADHTTVGNGCSVFGALVHKYKNADTSRWDETDEQGPTLEDGVLVGWGAVVCGNVRIGRNARILANALVTEDVPPGETYHGRERQAP